MIEDKQIWANERAYLERVLFEIKKQIDIGINAAANYKNDAIKLQKSMWEDLRIAPANLFDLENAAQINQIQMDLKNKASLYKFSYEKVSRLESMQKSPYFGRIDFLEKGEVNRDKIYIGLNNLDEYDTMQILVYDWRAPVSSMFYDFEIGLSNYTCPAGLIEGEILLKRQYKITDSDIVYMFDSSININDTMLQEILGKNTDNRMKTIVTSIQKEQNTVIRNDKDKILIVEGPAGSGKTSIALHRAAYLLYKYRETVTSENILIFSPNHVFEDYISHVLPEIGEENIRRCTFADLFGNAVTADKQYETVNNQMEYILSSNDTEDIRLDSIKFKASTIFLDVLKRYVLYLENGMHLKFKDLFYDNTLLISADEIKMLYKKQYNRLPYANRLEKISQRLFRVLDEYEKKRLSDKTKRDSLTDSKKRSAQQDNNAEYEFTKSVIFGMTAFDVYSLYIDLFRSIESFVQTTERDEISKYCEVALYTICGLEQGIINYEDLPPMVYLKTVLEGEYNNGTIKHIIIDEAQDYTPVQYEIFKYVFKNSNMTILGDINQIVNGYMNIGSFNTISDIFETGSRRINLTRSYRSTKELADFCKSLLETQQKTEQLNRHGAKPKVIKVSKNSYYNRVADDINELKNRGYKLIAIICKTAAECKTVCQQLSLYMDIVLVSNQNEVYYGDVVVIPSYLAKGLEFDAVLVSSLGNKAYNTKEERKLLYTVCTRALHELYLYYFDKMPDLISNIDKTLYTIDNPE